MALDINTIDLQIVKLLKENSRLSYTDLSRQVGLSPSAVRDHVLKLEDEGVIKNYTILLNDKKLGFDIEAIILLDVFSGQLSRVLREIPKISEIKEAHRITGSQNIHIRVSLKNQLLLQKLIDQLMKFGDTKTFVILSEIDMSSPKSH